MLPTINVPTYDVTLPASGIKVTYRPFLVKERSVLLMALQSEDSNTIINAIKNLASTCTFGKIDADKVPLVDVEFLFLNIRNKSTGEGLDLVHTCECGTGNEVSVMMDQLRVEGGTKDKSIQIADQAWITMNYPTINDVSTLSLEPTEDEVLSIISSCIESIVAGEQVYKAVDCTKEELREFILNLTQEQLNKIEDFFDDIPKITVKFSYTCRHCQKVNDKVIQGLENFFG